MLLAAAVCLSSLDAKQCELEGQVYIVAHRPGIRGIIGTGNFWTIGIVGIIGVIEMVMSSDLPLALPPRWIAQATMWIQKLTGLHNDRLRMPMTIPKDIPH